MSSEGESVIWVISNCQCQCHLDSMQENLMLVVLGKEDGEGEGMDMTIKRGREGGSQS